MDDIWSRARDALVRAVTDLGFPAELGNAIAKHLGSSKAIERMTAYLHYTKPNRAEEIVDEMLAIRSEIDAWKEKKASQHASGTINAMLRYGLEDQGEDRMVLPETLRQYIEETKQKMTEREFIEKQATALGVVITGKLRRSAENESAEVEKCFVDESGKLYMLRHGILTIRDAAGNGYWKVEDE